MKRINSQFLPIFFYVMLFVGVVVLGFLQFGWVSESAQRQLDSARKELALDVTKAIDAASNGYKQKLLQALADNPEQQPLFDHYLTIEYDRGWPHYSPDDVRFELVAKLDEAMAQPSPSVLVQAIKDLQQDERFTLVEVVDHHPTIEEGRFRIYLFTLDAEQLIQPELLDMLKISMPGCDFVISDRGEVFYSTLSGEPESAPEVRVSLFGGLPLPPLQRLDGELSFRESKFNRSVDSEGMDALLTSPDIFAFYERVLKLISTDNNGQRQGGIVISVYAPDGSLKDSASRQRILNSLFSTSVLVLLAVTAIVLNLAIRKARALHDRERDFVATISHELRTPLAVIRSAADNLNAGIVKSESVCRYGFEIIKQSKRLERMIESTLFYSGLPQQTCVQLAEVSSNSFFTDLLGPLRQLAIDKGIKLITEQNIQRPVMAIDTDAVRQIIENLILNAVIHGKPEVGQAVIWLDIEVRPKSLEISVADNGPGIPKDEQSKIFTAFTRGKRSKQEQHPGSGIGLNLILRTTRLLGGEVLLQSPYIGKLGTQQQGSLFQVELPLREVDDG
jgi:signal transduction histidine kinase